MAWCFYPRILVMGMGRFQAGVAFLAWSRLARGCGISRRTRTLARFPIKRWTCEMLQKPQKHPSTKNQACWRYEYDGGMGWRARTEETLGHRHPKHGRVHRLHGRVALVRVVRAVALRVPTRSLHVTPEYSPYRTVSFAAATRAKI